MVQLNLLHLATTALLFTPTLSQKTSQTNKGNRKIGIVIDESNSMRTNDPNNTRIAAALALNDFLIASDEKTNDLTPDQVAVVGFHDEPELLYPLGDPKGAGAVISNISSSKPGTFIGGGIGVATDDLTKPNTGETKGRSGIVVLTDGQDNFAGLSGVQGTINEIKRAGGLGIRVSFGFLSTDASEQDPEILTECVKTGGTFSSFSNAESQGNFIDQVIYNGLTALDGTADATGTRLLPGLKTSAVLSKDGNRFSYVGVLNEALNFTVSSLNLTLALKAELRDLNKNTEIVPAAKTNATGVATVATTLSKDANVQLVVSADGEFGEGIVTVEVQSSLGLGAGRGELSKSEAGRVSWSGMTVAVVGLGMGFLFL